MLVGIQTCKTSVRYTLVQYVHKQEKKKEEWKLYKRATREGKASGVSHGPGKIMFEESPRKTYVNVGMINTVSQDVNKQ